MGKGPGFIATAVFENTAYVSTNINNVRASQGEEAKRWPGLTDHRISTHGSEVPMSWYLTLDEKCAIEETIPSLPKEKDLNYAKLLTLLLRNFKENEEFFKAKDSYTPLCNALNYESMFQKVSALPERGRLRSSAGQGSVQSLRRPRCDCWVLVSHEDCYTVRRGGIEPRKGSPSRS